MCKPDQPVRRAGSAASLVFGSAQLADTDVTEVLLVMAPEEADVAFRAGKAEVGFPVECRLAMCAAQGPVTR